MVIAQIDSSDLKNVVPDAWERRKVSRNRAFDGEEKAVSYLSYLRYENDGLMLHQIHFARPDVMQTVQQLITINQSGGKPRTEGA